MKRFEKFENPWVEILIRYEEFKPSKICSIMILDNNENIKDKKFEDRIIYHRFEKDGHWRTNCKNLTSLVLKRYHIIEALNEKEFSYEDMVKSIKDLIPKFDDVEVL